MMATVPTNRTHARTEEALYPERQHNRTHAASIYPKTYERSSANAAPLQLLI